MRYVEFIAGPWEAPPLLGRLLGLVLPAANPDFETAYQRVTSWWLEIDDSGAVQREIGFDARHLPVAIAPFRDNFGIFTEHDTHPNPLGGEQDATQFDAAWNAVASRFSTAKHKPSAA